MENLLPEHLKELTIKSCIDAAVIEARGYKSITDKSALAVLGFAKYQQRVPALLIPYYDVFGRNGTCQIKPQKPRISKKTKKPVKYESVPDQPNIIDHSPIQPLEWLQDKSKRLWIIEGAKKADSHISKLREADIDEPVLSIVGCWGWGKDNILDPAFSDIAITGREIFLVPDGDVWDNDNVKLAMARLKGHLGKKRAKKVVVIGLPKNGTDGLDDYYASGWTLDQVFALIKPQLEDIFQDALLQQDSPPSISELGDRFIKKYPYYCFGLGDWRRQVDSGYWKRSSVEEIDTDTHKVILDAEDEGTIYNTYNCREIREYAKKEKFVPDEKWDNSPHLIPMANCLFDLSNMEPLPKALINGRYFSSGLDYEYSPDATCPLWENYLETLNRPPGEIQFLQEFLGYCLSASTEYELTLWLSGKRGAGKSTFIETAGKLLGNMAGRLSLKDVAESRFGLYALVGKRLVFSSENPSMYVKDIEMLNSIVSGETIRVEEKFIKQFDYKPFTKILWAMNEKPQVYQPESGFWRRVKVIHFDSAIQNPDTKLKEKLLDELPGIFNWAVIGYQRLIKNDGFTIPDSVVAATDEYELKNDIVGRFIAECTERSESNYIKTRKLYDGYRIWCRQSGHNQQSLSTVKDRLADMGFKIDRCQKGTANIKSAVWGLHLDTIAFTEAVTLSDIPSHKDYYEIYSFTDHSGGNIIPPKQ